MIFTLNLNSTLSPSTQLTESKIGLISNDLKMIVSFIPDFLEIKIFGIEDKAFDSEKRTFDLSYPGSLADFFSGKSGLLNFSIAEIQDKEKELLLEELAFLLGEGY